MAKVKITHVPYREAATARTDLMGGHVDLLFDALPASIGLVQSGKVKALATTYKDRSPALPNVPTVAESLPGFETSIFIGLLAPKNTPPAIADKLHDAINKILAKPETKEFLNKLGGAADDHEPRRFYSIPQQRHQADRASGRNLWSEAELMAKAHGIREVGYIDCAGGGQVVVKGNIAYIGNMKAPQGTTLVDVSDPKKPKNPLAIGCPHRHAFAQGACRGRRHGDQPGGQPIPAGCAIRL